MAALRRLTGLLLLIVSLASFSQSALGLEIALWEIEREDIQKVLDRLIVEFEKNNPGVTITRTHYGPEDLRTQFQTAAMGGGGANIVIAPSDFCGPFSIMRIIQPVGDWLDVDRFPKSLLGTVTDPNGRIWGVPISRGNHLMLYVNKSIVPAAPKTIEELIRVSKPLSIPAKKQFGFAYNLAEPFWFVSFYSAFGGHPLVSGKPVLAGKAMTDALQLVRDLKFKHRIVPPDCDYNCADTLFVERKVAMVINGDWAVQKYSDALKDDLIIAPLPKLEATGKHMEPMISGKFIFYHSSMTGEKLRAAKAFTEFLISEDVQKLLVAKTSRLPSIKSISESDVVSGDPILSATDKTMQHGQPMPMDVEMRVIWDAMRPQLQEVMSGRGEPAKAAALMQEDAVKKIAEMKGVDAKGGGYLNAVFAILVIAVATYMVVVAARAKKSRLAYLMLAPAFLGVCALIVYPFIFELRLAFANLNLTTIGNWLDGQPLGWAGFKQFGLVFTSSPLQTVSFWALLFRTFLWTVINVGFHVIFGLGLAMLLNRELKGRGVYRMLLIIPWAMPQVVAILAWRGEFHPQFGYINQVLELIGISGINWWSDPTPVFTMCCLVNIWLGIPFMMVIFLGGLQSIPNSYYEAASIDGASKWTQFWQVTVPMLKPVVVPSVTLGTIWTFNNINVIYLLTGQGGGNEYADILVSALYKSAFTYSRYSFSAAFALVIFAILLAVTIFWMKISRGTESVSS